MSDNNKKLKELVSTAEAALAEAELFAIKHGLEFSFSPAYGMGGTFYGSMEDSNKSYYGIDNDHGWIASSQTC